MRQLSQRALGGVVGGTMLVLGIAMLVLAKAPVQVVVSLAATGLLVSGAGRILGVRDAGPWRARWLDVVLGAGLLVAGVVALAWRTASLRLLAWVLAGALVASGVSALVQAWRAPRSRRAEEAFAGIPGSERAAGVFGGLATVLLGGLVLVWPRLSLVAFALVVGVWLTFSGLGMLVAARWPAARRSGHTSFVADDGGSHRASAADGDPGRTSDDVRGRAAARPPAGAAVKGPASRKRPRSVARRQLSLVGATGSFIVAVALAAGTIALHNLDPREEPDAFYTPPLSVPAEPGRLIRAEVLAANRVPTGLRGWRILYTSSDGDGAPTVVSSGRRRGTATWWTCCGPTPRRT